jgi:hypothetical protein
LKVGSSLEFLLAPGCAAVRAGAASQDEHLLLDHDGGYAPGWLDGQAQLFLGAVRAAESE